jgi:hypothetical protein
MGMVAARAVKRAHQAVDMVCAHESGYQVENE